MPHTKEQKITSISIARYTIKLIYADAILGRQQQHFLLILPLLLRLLHPWSKEIAIVPSAVVAFSLQVHSITRLCHMQNVRAFASCHFGTSWSSPFSSFTAAKIGLSIEYSCCCVWLPPPHSIEQEQFTSRNV